MRFGTAGIPLSTENKTTLNGIARVKELGLDGMELEFVHSVNISSEKAPEVKQKKEESGIMLTCHGQYYINLSSLEKEKIAASKERVLKAARAAFACGASSMTFHAGFYMKQTKEQVYDQIKSALTEITKTLQDEGNTIFIRPELTGKGTQWGELPELIKISQEVEQVLPCIDFAHQHARTNGKWNSKQEFSRMLEEMEKGLGKESLKNMHCHVSGIEYGEKGERNHLLLDDSDFKYRELLEALKEFSCKGIIICESPNIEDDCLLLKRTYGSL